MSEGPVGSQLDRIEHAQQVLCERLDGLAKQLAAFKDTYDWDLLVEVNSKLGTIERYLNALTPAIERRLDALAAAKKPAKRGKKVLGAKR
jgi:hypothetical protein